MSSDNADIYCMNEAEICRFYGEVLLKPVGRFNLSEFQKIWQESVPEGGFINRWFIHYQLKLMIKSC